MKKKVLVIDDFENTLFVTGFTIERAGYETIKAKSGSEALKILNSDGQIDLIITDYNMPNMNGLGLINEIKKIPSKKNIPIFVLSTEQKDEIKKAALHAGASLWLQKPFISEKLVEYIKRAIGQ
jgi:two-component system, chemotaxis family, chemotaxis protein CheY